MSYAKVYIHFVFTTKRREPFLDSPSLRKKVWKHIREAAHQKGIHLEIVNGFDDHCHCLVSMNRSQTLSEIMHLIKGESAHWINSNKLCKSTFEWQDQYFAISVSESIVQRVRQYILNQENHHKQRDFQHEYDRIVREHGFSITNFD
jgi:putative transposase